MTTESETSLRPYAIVTGVAYLLMGLGGMFAEFVVGPNLIVAGDAAATARNILAAEWPFRIGIISFLLVFLDDVLVAWGLYVLLRPVNRNLSLLAAFFRVAMAAVLAINMLNKVIVLLLLSGADYLGAFDPQQLEALALLLLEAHSYGFAIGLNFFGLHCLVVGWLLYRSAYFPSVLGLLMAASGLSYHVMSVSTLLGAGLSPFVTGVAIAGAIIGEFALIFWLLFMSHRVQHGYAATLHSA